MVTRSLILLEKINKEEDLTSTIGFIIKNSLEIIIAVVIIFYNFCFFPTIREYSLEGKIQKSDANSVLTDTVNNESDEKLENNLNV